MRDKVLAFVRQNGPCLPIEIGSKVSGDSFLAKAYLEELVEKGLLKKTEKKIGESYIYFAAGQEQAAETKLASLDIKKTAGIYAPMKIEVTPEIAKKREEFDSRLRKIEAEEKKAWLGITKEREKFDTLKRIEREEKSHLTANIKRPAIDIAKNRLEFEKSRRTSHPAPSGARREEVDINPNFPVHVERPTIAWKEFDSKLKRTEAEEKWLSNGLCQTPHAQRQTIEIIPKQPFFEAAKDATKKITAKPKEEVRDAFIDEAINFLTNKNVEILQKEEKGKNADLIVNIPSAVGLVTFLIKIKSKKKISRSELVAIYVEALEQRMPAILLTTGELAETAKKYLNSVGGFLRVKVF